MARPKTFDRTDALRSAARTFAAHGFEGTSTESLLASMGIGRQSLYDTFGDKKQLYLAALSQYQSDSVSETLHALGQGPTPLDGIEHALVQFAARTNEGCLGVSAICEFGRADVGVTTATDAMSRILLTAFERRFEEAKSVGQVDPALASAEVAGFLSVLLAGMKVNARAGATRDDLRGTVRLALRAFAPRPRASNG